MRRQTLLKRKRGWVILWLMRNLVKYLYCRKGMILIYLATFGLLLLLAYASYLPLKLVTDAMAVIGFILALVLVTGSLSFFAKYRRLQEIQENISIFPGDMPKGRGCIEESYLKIIKELYHLLEAEQAKAEARKGEISDYYTMWVHQIKTPISGLHLALQTGEADPALAQQELFKIRQYVDMALNYTRLEDLSSDLMVQRYDVDEIVLETVRKCSVLFISKNLGVIAEPTAIEVETDSKWLGFILEQLLTNAAKYTYKGGVRVYGCGSSLHIKDSGIGIRPEDKERIFERGFTGYNGRLDRNASGLGLYLVKTVADALSIDIEVESKMGEGTTMTLHFPKSPSQNI